MNTIYALIEVQSRTKFYVGQTYREPHIRLSEHRYGAKNYKEGDELKYQYAHALDELGIEWDMLVLAQIETEKDAYSHDDVEDYYVNLYRAEPLTNMRAGNSEPWFGVDYPNVESMVTARTRYQERNKFKEPKVAVKKESDVDKMLYSFEKPSKFTAPAFDALKNKRRK